jgi:hypothetical protein
VLPKIKHEQLTRRTNIAYKSFSLNETTTEITSIRMVCKGGGGGGGVSAHHSRATTSHKKKKNAKKKSLHLASQDRVTMQRKEEKRRFSTEGLGLARRISPATRHLAASYQDPQLGLADRGLGFFFFFFLPVPVSLIFFFFRMIQFQIGFT